MMINDRRPPERVRLFGNDKLERLTFVTPRTFAVTWAAILSLVVYACWGVASLWASISYVTGGLVLWTLVEYSMHRFAFHLKTRSEQGQSLLFVLHGNHHATPNDAGRNLMPPIVSVVIAALVWSLLVLVLGGTGSLIFLGWIAGYVAYDGIHYACHQLPMRGPLLRQLRRHHIRHHFARDEGNFAVTAIFWDSLFGTKLPSKAN